MRRMRNGGDVDLDVTVEGGTIQVRAGHQAEVPDDLAARLGPPWLPVDPPARSDRKAVWAAFAAAQGDPDAHSSTKDELVDRWGEVPDQTGGGWHFEGGQSAGDVTDADEPAAPAGED